MAIASRPVPKAGLFLTPPIPTNYRIGVNGAGCCLRLEGVRLGFGTDAQRSATAGLSTDVPYPEVKGPVDWLSWRRNW